MTQYTYSAFSMKPSRQFNIISNAVESTIPNRWYDQMTDYTCSAVSIKPAEQFQFNKPKEVPLWERRNEPMTESTRSDFSVKPPEQFDFSKPEEFPIWKRRYDRYRNVSHHNQLSDAEQIDYLCYIMGPKAEEILISFKLTAAEKENYAIVSKKFDEYFVPKRNIIYERSVFNRRTQQLGESVADFVAALQKLSETCEYGDLKDELVRDRIVVGLSDMDASYSLQLQADLTLETAIQFAQRAEMVKKQQRGLDMRSSDESTFNYFRKSDICMPSHPNVARKTELGKTAIQFAQRAETVKKQLHGLGVRSSNESPFNRYPKPADAGMPSNSSVAKKTELGKTAIQFAQRAETVKKQLHGLGVRSSNESPFNHYPKPADAGMPSNSSVAKKTELGKTAIQFAQRAETVKKQLRGLGMRSSNESPFNHYPKPADADTVSNSSVDKETELVQSEPEPKKPKEENCWRCGNICSHARRNCPARNATCSRCFRRYHFAQGCPYQPSEKSKDIPKDCIKQNALRAIRKSLTNEYNEKKNMMENT